MLPRGIYPCQDGYVCIQVTNEWWPRLAQMLERPDLLTDPKFATAAARMQVEHQREFDAFFYPWLLARTKQEIMERAQAARVLATAVNTPEDVLRDRHFQARGFFVEVDHPDAGLSRGADQGHVRWRVGQPIGAQAHPWDLPVTESNRGVDRHSGNGAPRALRIAQRHGGIRCTFAPCRRRHRL